MTNPYWERITGRDLELRAADADRDRIAQRLRESHAEGRLDLAEFQERLERCYAAKTLGQLSELVRDLPRAVEPAPRRSLGSRLTHWPVAPLVPLLIALVLVSAVTGHHHHAAGWLWLPLMFAVWRMVWWRRGRWAAGSRRRPGDWG